LSEKESSRLVVTHEPRRTPDRLRAAAAQIPILLGVAFLTVGLVDLVLLWIPVRMDSVAWEFATVGRTLDGLPMPALGIGLLAYGASRHPRLGLRSLRGFAVMFGFLALVLAVLAGLFATLAPAVLSQTPVEALEGARRGVIRHAVQAAVYPLAFFGLALILWRAGRR
jgi:hypothetical protein